MVGGGPLGALVARVRAGSLRVKLALLSAVRNVSRLRP